MNHHGISSFKKSLYNKTNLGNPEDYKQREFKSHLIDIITGIEGPLGTPPQLTGLTVMPNISTMTVDLNWDASPSTYNTQFYAVYRRPIGSSPQDLRCIGVSIDTHFKDDYKSTPGMSYYYAVAGVNELGEGEKCSEIQAVFPSSGIVTTSRTWEGNINLTGSVTILSGVTLTITPGSTVNFQSNGKIYLQSGEGQLVDDGVTYIPSRRVEFSPPPPTLVNAWSDPNADPLNPNQRCRAKLTFTPVPIAGVTDYVLWWEFGDNVYTNCSTSPCPDARCVKSRRQVCIKNLMYLSSFPHRINFENSRNDPSSFVFYEDPEGFFYEGTCHPYSYSGRYWIEIEGISEENGNVTLDLHFPDFWAPGAEYTFKMAAVKDGAISNWSNAKTCFIVDAPQTITVTSPSWNEQLKAGTQKTIQWSCENFTGSEVMIDYIYDNTYTPKEIKYHVPNTGLYVWTVPEENSTLCQIRVWDPEDWYPWGNSAIFTIYPKEITVLSPDGGQWVHNS